MTFTGQKVTKVSIWIMDLETTEEITLQPPSPVARTSALGATLQGFTRNEWSCPRTATVLQLPPPKENAAEKPVCGRMPVPLNAKRAGSKFLPINQVIRGSKNKKENCGFSVNTMPSIVRNREGFCPNQADGNYSIVQRQSRALSIASLCLSPAFQPSPMQSSFQEESLTLQLFLLFLLISLVQRCECKDDRLHEKPRDFLC